MGGWTFEVAQHQVKIKTKVCTVRAFSHEQAIEFAKQMACWDDDGTSSSHVEYAAREITYD